jgi:formate hydrogenlyase subunit 3/multisubunit Na+/H+ antiporter MnhD subunit
LERITVAAIASFAGFVASVALYTSIPVAREDVSWQTPEWWLTAILLVAGLTCFVVFLITGMIAFLNRGSAVRPRKPRQE